MVIEALGHSRIRPIDRGDRIAIETSRLASATTPTTGINGVDIAALSVLFADRGGSRRPP
jgi:hypothetical protein